MESLLGYKCETFTFEGRDAIIVFPSVKPIGKLALKTLYWGAFPDVEKGCWTRAFMEPASKVLPDLPLLKTAI